MARRDEDSSFERIRRRAPSVRTRHTVAQLLTTEDQARRIEEHGDLPPKFTDRSLQELYENGLLDEIVVEMRSGKEATVFVGRNASGKVAVKLYRDLSLRSFRNDRTYREGRFIGDARTKRAIENASRRGVAAHELLWVEQEFRQLVALHDAGVSVPRPIGHAGTAIAMEFIGDDDEPAPRLSDISLTGDDAVSAFEQAVENLALIAYIGRVHGDYSTFNLLWHNRRVIVIDLPQVVFMHECANAADLLRRDVTSLCHTFRRHGIDADVDEVLSEIIDEEEWRRLTIAEARVDAERIDDASVNADGIDAEGFDEARSDAESFDEARPDAEGFDEARIDAGA